MYKALVVAAGAAMFLLLNTAASAQYGYGPGVQIEERCRDHGNGYSCRTIIGPREQPGAKIITVPGPRTEQEAAEQAAHEAEWTRVCEPIVVLDPYGVSRYTYGPRCPNGVMVGDGKRPRR